MLELLKRLPRRLFGYRLKFHSLRSYGVYRVGQAGDQRFSLAVHLRVMNKSARHCSLVALQIQEPKGPVWDKISEVVRPPQNEPQLLPLHVPGRTAVDFWIRTYSPPAFPQLLSIGRLKLKVKDHTGKQYKQWLMVGPTDFFIPDHT